MIFILDWYIITRVNTKLSWCSRPSTSLYTQVMCRETEPGHYRHSSESCKYETIESLFSWVCASLKAMLHCQRSVRFFPRIFTPLLATCRVLHPLTMLAAMLSSDQIWTVLIGRTFFDQSVACTFFRDLSLVFFGPVRKIFPPRDWKYSLFQAPNNHFYPL